MLTCRELAEELSSGAYDQRGWLFKLKLRFHAFICPPCRAYANQLNSISSGAKAMLKHQEPAADKLSAMQERCLSKLGTKKTCPENESNS